MTTPFAYDTLPAVMEDGNSYGTYLDNLFTHLTRIGVDGWNLGLESYVGVGVFDVGVSRATFYK